VAMSPRLPTRRPNAGGPSPRACGSLAPAPAPNVRGVRRCVYRTPAIRAASLEGKAAATTTPTAVSAEVAVDSDVGRKRPGGANRRAAFVAPGRERADSSKGRAAGQRMLFSSDQCWDCDVARGCRGAAPGLPTHSAGSPFTLEETGGELPVFGLLFNHSH
jgi:hypothetical protein